MALALAHHPRDDLTIDHQQAISVPWFQVKVTNSIPCWPMHQPTHKHKHTQHCDMVTLYLAKNGVLSIQLRCRSKSKKELTLIIVRTSISHSNQPSSHKTEPLVKFIL